MLRRTYRVFVDMDVKVLPINESSIRRWRERWRDDLDFGLPAAPIPDERKLAPQRALQRELFEDRPMLDRRMEFEAFMELLHGYVFDGEAIELDHDGFLSPLAERLSLPARERFRRAFSYVELDLLLDEFFRCFEITVVDTDIARIHGPFASWGASEEVLRRRRYRITIDAEIVVKQASVERVRARDARRALERDRMGLPELPYERPPPLSEEEMGFVQELLDEVIREPDRLDTYLKHDVLGGLRDGDLEGHGPEDYGDVHALVDRLPVEHQRWFRAAAARDMFYEGREHFESSFQAEPLGITIFALGD